MSEEPTPPQQEQPTPAEPQATAPAEEQPTPPVEQPAAQAVEEQPAPAEPQPAPPVEQPAAQAVEEPAAPPVEEQPAPAEPAGATPAEATPPAEQPAPAGEGQPADAAPKKRRRPRSRRPAQVPRREKGPLPINELRDAARAATEAYGAKRALRDAFALLAAKERADLSALVSADEDHRPRARNIATGSLGAGRLGKAIAAQQIAMARTEELWTLTLSKEEAADKLARVRNARQRDERRAKRDAERAQRSDRVSRAELAAAQDGRVGAQIRIVGPEGEEQPRRKPPAEDAPPAKKGSSVLDRLGY
jgi:hypothetical protein